MIDDLLRGRDADSCRADPVGGRPSVAAERLAKAQLPQVLRAIRSWRGLCRHLETDLLFRSFLDITLDEDVSVATGFTLKRERIAECGLTRGFCDGVARQATAAEIARRERQWADRRELG